MTGGGGPIRVEWPEGRVLLSWVPTAELDDTPVTAAHCFCFDSAELLVVRHRERGWCIPGGHLEAGESPETALLRELREEASVVGGSLELLGGMRVDHAGNPSFRTGGRYPRVAVQLMYRALARRVDPFRACHETVDRQLVSPADLPSVHHEWNEVLQAALDAAVARGSS